jgi:hypothetical protein
MPSGFGRFTTMGGTKESLYGDGRGFDPISVTFTGGGSPNVVVVGHGLRAGRGVIFTAGGGLPAALTGGTRYYVVSVVDADTFTVAATKGGTAIAMASVGTPPNTVTPDPIVLCVENDGFGLYPQPSFTEVVRQVGSLEAPERLATEYNVQGTIRVILYPDNSAPVIDAILRRTNSETDSFAIKHFSGMGTDTTLLNVGAKAGRVTFSAERGGGNPDILCAVDWRAQKDSEVANPATPAAPVLPAAKGFTFLTAYFEARDDTAPAPADSLVSSALAFTIVVDQALQQQGREVDVDGSPTDAGRMKSLVTGLAAGIQRVSGTFRINPTNTRYLSMIRNQTVGRLRVCGFHRTSRLLSTVNNLAAGATTMFLPLRQTAGSGVFTTAFATDDFLTSTSHGLQNDQAVTVQTTTTLPAPLIAGLTYYVRDRTVDKFKLALTKGGAAIDITSDGTGTQTWVQSVGGAGGMMAGDTLLLRASGTPAKAEVITVAAIAAELVLTAVSATDVGDLFTKTAHGLVNGQAVVLAAPPAGFTANTTYYVIAATANDFQLSLTVGGSAVAVTADGSGITVTTLSVALTIQGRGAGNGTLYAWTAASTQIYSVAIELFVPSFQVTTAPFAGGPGDITSQEVAWEAEATTGVQPILWAVPQSSLYS